MSVVQTTLDWTTKWTTISGITNGTYGATPYTWSELDTPTWAQLGTVNYAKVYRPATASYGQLMTYVMGWTSQVNFRGPTKAGQVLYNWISPNWVASSPNAYANYICKSTFAAGSTANTWIQTSTTLQTLTTVDLDTVND